MFKVKSLAGAAALACMALASASAGAAPTIGFGNIVTSGPLISVDVIVDGLGTEIVSAYDLDVSFDDTALSFDTTTGLSFGVMLGGPLDSFQDGPYLSNNVIDFAEVSFLLDDPLFALQNGGPVTLATLTFTGSDVGSLQFVNWGVGLPTNDVKGRRNQVIIPGGQVPEPSTYALAGLALAGMFLSGAGRRRRQSGG